MDKSLKDIALILFFVSSIFFGCTGTENSSEKDNEVVYNGGDKSNNQNKESLIDRNKQMILEEQEKIDSFISKNNYKMEETKTGIHYSISEVGKGEKPKTLSEVALKYTINLLDGTYCYSSDSSGVLQMKIGQSSEPTGLQEVLQQIPCGSKAKIIIPSYLAYGLSGDGDKIGSGASLLYTIELLKVKN
jgi:FKBP-type peptidyl-prolyl cis-trans isomerase